MEHTNQNRSTVISNGGKQVERMRRALNSAYSGVPSELDELFYAALDQVADQQVKVSTALTRLIDTGDHEEAERVITVAMTEAQRSALRAARAYADNQHDAVEKIYDKIIHLPTNTTDLVDKKRKLDEIFSHAVRRHDEDNIEALEPLLEVADAYKNWCSDAQIRIVGAQGIVESDKKRIMLQWIAIAVALLLGIVNVIINLINFLRK
jgi:DNA-binding MarR family transcriptional regulator